MFRGIASAFRESPRPDKVKVFSEAFKRFQDEIEDAVLPPHVLRHSEARKGAQSKQFMMQILPTVQAYMRQFPKGHQFQILDVGPGTGFGANLLASLYQTVELGYRARVSTTDIVPDYFDFMKIFCRFVSPNLVDVFEMDRTFDIVIASHVVEHVPDWLPFVQRLQDLSRGIVILCAPYQENPETLTKGHINIIDDDFLAALQPANIEFMESPAWGQFMEPRYKMFVATLTGKASGEQGQPAEAPS